MILPPISILLASPQIEPGRPIHWSPSFHWTRRSAKRRAHVLSGGLSGRLGIVRTHVTRSSVREVDTCVQVVDTALCETAERLPTRAELNAVQEVDTRG